MNAQRIVGFAGSAIVVAIQVACSGSSPSSPPDPYSAAGSTNAAPSGAATGVAPHAVDAGGAAPASSATPSPNGGTTTRPPSTTPAAPGVDGALEIPDVPGQGATMSVGEHCCVNGEYFHCPNAAACLGGFDINACIEGCNFTDARCIQNCTAKLRNGGTPVGCDANAAPPAGVDCANGTININR